MKHCSVEQYSEEWFRLRCGIPTASSFDKIITPKERRPSKSSVKYAYRLLAERVLGKPDIDPVETEYMRRGLVMENEAALWYAVTRGVEVVNGGFVTTDDGRIGCSPDRLVGDDGLLEIKCLGAPGHVAALFGDTDSYELQVQAQLWICERSWADRLYYHPDLTPLVERVLPDLELHADLDVALRQFCERLDEMEAELRAKATNVSMGWPRKWIGRPPTVRRAKQRPILFWG